MSERCVVRGFPKPFDHQTGSSVNRRLNTPPMSAESGTFRQDLKAQDTRQKYLNEHFKCRLLIKKTAPLICLSPKAQAGEPTGSKSFTPLLKKK